MKKLKLLFCTLLALTALVSCEEENLDPIGEWDLSAPAFNAGETSVVLDEETPSESFSFSWAPSVSSERYQVRYAVVIDTVGSTDYSTPVLRKTSGNGGKDTSISFTASEIDLAMSYAGFPVAEASDLEMAVIATSIDKQATDVQTVSITRFVNGSLPEQLYISGAATEAGTDLSQAIPMRSLKDADGNTTFNFEVYTHLESGAGFKLYSQQELPANVYGGEDGKIIINGPAITVPEAGEYRLSVNLNEKTYELLKIDRFSFVGEGIPNGWGGDEPLEYIGNGVWQKVLSLQVPESGQGGFLFRANGDWAYLFKRIQGTTNDVYMESQAAAGGVAIEDITFHESGNFLVTLDLSKVPYTYSLELQEDQSTDPPSSTPEELFLLADGAAIGSFTKDGDVFTSETYLPLQASVSYQLNSAADGTGTAYKLSGTIGETTTPDGDAVFANLNLFEGPGAVAVARDQAYKLSFNFSTGKATWKYYNIKLFHWDEPGGGWDARNEYLMTYVHPHKFTTTADLKAGYHMKFNSPWEVQFGADDAAALSGTMTNNGGSNFNNITTSGNYNVSIETTPDYATGTYVFVKN